MRRFGAKSWGGVRRFRLAGWIGLAVGQLGQVDWFGRVDQASSASGHTPSKSTLSPFSAISAISAAASASS